MKKFYEKYLRNFACLCIITSLLLNLAIECFSRRSFIDAIKYLVSSPLVFLYNSSIILVTLSVVLLVKRRVFVYSLISVIWLAGGITNGIVLSNRVTPFTAVELKLLDSVLSVMTKYFNKFQIGLIIAGIALVVIGLIIAFIKAPKRKEKINYRKNISLFILGVCSFLVLTKVAIKTEVVSNYFGNIAFAYLDYGFPYCISNTLVNTGIEKPANYSEKAVKSIFGEENYSSQVGNGGNVDSVVTNEDVNATSQKKPNIIFLQLESFFDPTHIKGLEFSEDPIPNYRRLMEQYSSGYLSVPSVGAGTANTEFETISGMNLEFFGPGEYPYKTILRKTTEESIPYDLKEIGYSTHAIHNNKGTFYPRQNVFKMLGFDTFTSVEYMNITEKTPMEWAKDKFLTQPILDALNSTEGSDYIYTISVQGHGSYPEVPVEGHSKITVSGIEDEARKNAIEYYVNEIHEMDQWIGELTNTLSNYGEDIVLVMYGDHLPSLSITDEELTNGDIYQTQYIAWSNFGLQKEDKDLEAYQLGANILGRLGINNGTLVRYHQLFQGTENYEKNLKMLQYDMLYGERYIYDKTNPFSPTKMKMGVKDVVIENAYNEDGNIYVKGQNFTPSSEVMINDSNYEVEFIDENTLLIKEEALEDGDELKVKQVTETDFTLSTSEKYIYTETSEIKQDNN